MISICMFGMYGLLIKRGGEGWGWGGLKNIFSSSLKRKFFVQMTPKPIMNKQLGASASASTANNKLLNASLINL